MQLSVARLSDLTKALRTTHNPPIVNVDDTGNTYRLVACYDGANPAVLAIRVDNDNRPMDTHFVLMTETRFGVPSPLLAPDIRHPLCIDDVADMVAHGKFGKVGYSQTARHLLLGLWRHGIQPSTEELQLFIQQTVNSHAVLDTYGGRTCLKAVFWATWPKAETAVDTLVPVVVSHLITRAATNAADSVTEALQTTPATKVLAAA